MIGEVGYEFRKQFDEGWFTGKVVKIRPGAAHGKDRRCLYEDGDTEDLSLAELRTLAKRDPNNNNNNKSSRVKVSTTSSASGNNSTPYNKKPSGNSNSSASSYQNEAVRRSGSGRELTASVKLAGYQVPRLGLGGTATTATTTSSKKENADKEKRSVDNNKGDDEEEDHTITKPTAVRKSAREKKPTRTYEEIMIAEQTLKKRPSSPSSSSSLQPSKANKLQKLLSSLNNDYDVPVDRAAESTFKSHNEQQSSNVWDEEDRMGYDSEDEHNEWLEKVASQLGAKSRPMSRNSMSNMTSPHNVVVANENSQTTTSRLQSSAVPSSRNSVQSPEFHHDTTGGNNIVGQQKGPPPAAANAARSQAGASTTNNRSIGASESHNLGISTSIGKGNLTIPSSVLVSHRSNLPPPGTTTNSNDNNTAVRTLIDIEKGARHEYLVFDVNDPKRLVGEVLIEGRSGWVEVCFGQADLVKCRSSNLIIIPKNKFNVGDSVPDDYITIMTENGGPVATTGQLKSAREDHYAMKQTCDDKSSSLDKKRSSKPQSIDLNDLFYWVCSECELFNTTTDKVCQSCHVERAVNAKTSKLLEVAEAAVNSNDFVTTIEEALVNISELDRQSIPELILAQLLEAKYADKKFKPLAAKPSKDIATYFYWSCGVCTMLNSYKKASCGACGDSKGFFSRSSPLLQIAEQISSQSKNPEDAYAKWPNHETHQIPEVVMDSLITCVHIIKKKGTERRCRGRKLEGFDFCKDHCDPIHLTARVSDVTECPNTSSEADTEDKAKRPSLLGFDGMRQSLQNFFATKVESIKNALGWTIGSIEDSLICESESKPFPLGMKVRTYFIGYDFHDGRIIKVRRQFVSSAERSQDPRPVLMYRVVYNDGDQQDWLHSNIASLRQVFDINNVDAEDDIENQIPIGTMYELISGDTVRITGHTLSNDDERGVSFIVEDDSNAPSSSLDLSVLKFQVAVKRRISNATNNDPLSIVAEWPVESERIDKSCGTGMRYKVCNGLHLLGKSHPDDYSVVPVRNKLPGVDDPRDFRPGVKPKRWDPAGVYSYTRWDPSQSLICELCGIDKDDNQVVICDQCHVGFHSYCLRPVMVNIPRGDWVCRSCSGKSNSISFVDYSKSINGKQQDVLQFLNLPYNSYKEFVEENAEAISFSHSSSSYNANVHTAVDRNLFSIGSILFVRSPDRHDFRLPSLPASEEEYASIIESHVAAMKYSGMTKYSETNTIKENGHATDAMNNSDFEIDHITPLSKRNLAIFCAFKENLKRGIFPPIKVNYDEKYGFYVEAIRAIPKHTLITEYIGELITLEESSESDSLMILLDSGDPKTSLIIDPTNAGSIARFFSGVNNKSIVSKRKANIRTRRFCLDGKLHVVLFTSKRIEPCERLNYDYNAGREGKSSQEWLKGGFYDTSNFF